jgi:hypothetical protein
VSGRHVGKELHARTRYAGFTARQQQRQYEEQTSHVLSACHKLAFIYFASSTNCCPLTAVGCAYCRLRLGWLWGSIANRIARRLLTP